MADSTPGIDPHQSARSDAQPRVGLLINAVHARVGGGLTYLRSMLPLLAADGRFRIDLLLHADQVAALPPLPAMITVHVAHPPGGFWSLLLWEQVKVPLLARAVGAAITFSPANYGPLFAPRTVLFIQNALGVARVESRFRKRLYWYGLAIATWLSVLTCRRAIVATRYMRDGSPGKHKLTVVPMGVDPVFRDARRSPRQPPFLLAVGDVYIQKNYHTLIDAFAMIAKDFADLTLKIAGRPLDVDYLRDLHGRVRAAGLDGRVAFLGEQSQDAVRALFETASAFVMPSTIESFGLPLLEAMACGLPSASSRAAALPEIGGDSVLYFDPENPHEIADALRRLLTDPALRATLSQREAVASADFTWERTARETLAVLQDALSP